MASVRQLHRSEVAASASLLARAFTADPFLGHFMADPRRRRLALPPFFAAVLHELIGSKGVYVSEHQGEIRLLRAPAIRQPHPRAPLRDPEHYAAPAEHE